MRPLKGSLGLQEIALLEELETRGSHRVLKGIVKGMELDDFQTYTLAKCIIAKSVLVSLDTGTGKTIIAIGLMNYLKAVYGKEFHMVYICEKNNLSQTVKKIEEGSNLTCISMTGEKESVAEAVKYKNPMNYDVIIFTYQALESMEVVKFFIKNKDSFVGIIVDESHNLGNEETVLSRAVSGMCRWVKYRTFLTATPLTTKLEQSVNQLKILDDAMVQDVRRFVNKYAVRDTESGQITGYKNLEQFRVEFRYRYVNYTRDMLGMRGNYNIQVADCEPTEYQMECSKEKIKSDMSGEHMRVLVKMLEKYKDEGKKGLIYINIDYNKDIAMSVLQEEGFRLEMLDGRVPHWRRDEIRGRYNNGEFDFLITNLTRGSDLPSDYIIFYELTNDIKQMIGRAERGLEGTDLDVVFLVVRGTKEEGYFRENIYKNAILLRDAMGKDVSEIERARLLI